tara:strand:+ start:1729 stop:2139 length:411 start_codon:yes stop_codon:yes gene_type:complete
MKTEKLKELYDKYKLSKDDFFKHQHFTIVTRSGVEKISALENIKIKYDVIRCEPNFAVIKATAEKNNIKIETFGSALKGDTFRDGNCSTFYIAEMAEKRAMSRAVLKITGFYSLGVFSEDESESFKRPKTEYKTLN